MLRNSSFFGILVFSPRNSRILGLGILVFLWGAGYFFFRNSRIPYYVIPPAPLGDLSIWNFRILCYEIPQSSWGMTKKVNPVDDKESQVWDDTRQV